MTRETVSGTWYVVRTSLSFWRRRTDPSVTYAPLPDGRVVDTVRYLSRGRPRLVVGVDVPDGEGWVWRGITPLTRLTSSRWQVVEAQDEWALTHFEKTLFTPEGWDVYCRAPQVSASSEEALRAALARHDVPDLFAPLHTAGAR